MIHTKEPWVVLPKDQASNPFIVASEATGLSIADCLCPIGGNNEQNARRIVACVNALEGLNDDALIGGWSFKGIEAYAKELAKERDELLAEKDQNDFSLLKTMIEIFDIMNNPEQFRSALAMAVEKRSAAITNAKVSNPVVRDKRTTETAPAIVFCPAGILGEEVRP